jgi:hypothetical protein
VGTEVYNKFTTSIFLIVKQDKALKLLLIGGIFLTIYLAFAALLQCFMHQIYTWTFIRQIKTLVALYKLKPSQNLTCGNIFTVLQAMDRHYKQSKISKL